MQAGRSKTGSEFGEHQLLVEMEQNPDENRGTEAERVSWGQS